MNLKLFNRIICVTLTAALALSSAVSVVYADEYLPVESQAVSEIKAPNVYVKALGSDSVTLGFSDVEGAIYYQVTMSEDSLNYYEAGSIILAGENECVVNGLISGRTYYFRLYAADIYGSLSSLYSECSVEIGNTKCTLAEPALGENGVDLQWTATENAAMYRVYRSLTKKGGYKNIKTVYTTSYTDSKISVGDKYYYKIMPITINEEGKKVKNKCSAIKNFTVSIEAPVLSDISYDNAKYIKLSWDKKFFGAGYKVYRSESKSKNYKLIKTVEGVENTEFYDYSVEAGTKYYYKVSTYYGEKESGYSAIKSQWTASAHPTDLMVKPSDDGVLLTWSKTKSSSAYNVFRSTDAAENFQIIGYKIKGTSFTDNDILDPNQAYYYRISAVHGSIEGIMSNAVSYSAGELSLNTKTVFISVGESIPVTVYISDEGSVIYESEDESIAGVSSDGVITGVSAGKTNINVSAGGKSASCSVTVTDYPELGIDISKHQGDINWTRLKASGIDYVMLRIGYGLDIERKYETKFEEYYDGAEMNNIPMGVYCYSTAMTPEEATAEAEFIIQRLEGRPLSLPVALDFEDDKQRKLSKEDKALMVKNYKTTIENAGYKFILYASASWVKDYIDQNLLEEENIDLWIARYRDISLGVGYEGKGNVRMWQYSDKGKIDGILDDKGNYIYVDLDVTVGDNLFT